MCKPWWNEYCNFVYAGKAKEAKQLLLKEIPKDMMAYKYVRGTNRDWNTIAQQKLWLCQACRFNDPYDCAFLINCHTKERYDPKTECGKAVHENNLQRTQDNKSKRCQESVYIACFSERYDSLLMWSHYANEHQGLCIGYNLHALIEKYDCFPVIYSKDMPNTIYRDDELPNAMDASILTKSKDWSYEQEWRIINIDKPEMGNGGKSIPFEKPSVIYVGVHQIKSIPKNHAKCSETKKDNTGKTDIEIFQSADFFVDYREISDYARSEKVDLHEMMLSRSTFSLDCTGNIIF